MTEPAKGGPSSVRALCSPRNLTQPHATVLSSWPGPCHQSTRPTTPTRRLRLVHQLGHLRSITNSPILHPSGWKLPVISVGKWDGSFWPQGNGTLGSGRQACESAWCGASGSSARANVASREASESSARPALVAVPTGQFGSLARRSRCSGTQPASRALWLARRGATDACTTGGVTRKPGWLLLAVGAALLLVCWTVGLECVLRLLHDLAVFCTVSTDVSKRHTRASDRGGC